VLLLPIYLTTPTVSEQNLSIILSTEYLLFAIYIFITSKFKQTVRDILHTGIFNFCRLEDFIERLDPKGLIRRKLSPVSSNTLFQCSSETRLHMLNISQSKIQNKKEEMKIINFIMKEFEESFALQNS
jgi:hypothetical protein